MASDNIKKLFNGFEEDMQEHGIGSIAELYDGDPPHYSGGALSYAWNVAELLRMEQLIIILSKYLVYEGINVWLGISASHQRGTGDSVLRAYQGHVSCPGLEVTFVVPKIWGDEDQSSLKLLAAGNFPIRKKHVEMKGFLKEMTFLEVHSRIFLTCRPKNTTK
jgi:hypothetical protein